MQAVIHSGYMGGALKPVGIACCYNCDQALSKAQFKRNTYLFCTNCMDGLYAVNAPFKVVGSLTRSRL